MELRGPNNSRLTFSGRFRVVVTSLDGQDCAIKENITRAIEDGEIHVTDTRGNVLLSVNLPELSEGVRDLILSMSSRTRRSHGRSLESS